MQMKDVTRGPAMHNEQFDGLIWQATPLFEAKRVWLLGASDVACEVAKLATHLGFLVTVADYVCVLTRGHMYDPQSCAWGVVCNAHYVGMMGCKGKNETVHDLVIGLGATEEGWARIKRPIGLKFGAKTPAELAVSIVAELIDVRHKENYSDAARAARKPSSTLVDFAMRHNSSVTSRIDPRNRLSTGTSAIVSPFLCERRLPSRSGLAGTSFPLQGTTPSRKV